MNYYFLIFDRKKTEKYLNFHEIFCFHSVDCEKAFKTFRKINHSIVKTVVKLVPNNVGHILIFINLSCHLTNTTSRCFQNYSSYIFICLMNYVTFNFLEALLNSKFSFISYFEERRGAGGF